MCCTGSIVTGILLGMGLLCLLNCLKGACRKRHCCPKKCGGVHGNRSCWENRTCGMAKSRSCEKRSCCTKPSCKTKPCCAQKPGCRKPCCVKPSCRQPCCSSGGRRHSPGSCGHGSGTSLHGGRGRGGGRSGCRRCGHRPYGGSGMFGGSHRHYTLLSSEDDPWVDGGGDCERVIALHDLNSYHDFVKIVK